MTVVIVGYGVVGKNLNRTFPAADIHDPALGLRATLPGYDVAFVCVPTDLKDGRMDTSVVIEAIQEINADVYVIKSTVPPGTTQRLHETMDAKLVFSPEYAGETVNANGYEYPFVILGEVEGGRGDSDVVAELYKRTFTGEIRIFKTDSKTAELVKFYENAFLALKVTFVNEFARLADALGVDRDELRELWLLDPRVGRSHSFAFRDQPFYDSKCLNKDVPGIVAAAHDVGVQMPLIQYMVGVNEARKKKADWDGGVGH